MSIHESGIHEGQPVNSIGRPGAAPNALKQVIVRVWQWPVAARLALLGILVLYIPVVREVGQLWLHDDTYSHGLLILPVSLYLLWMQREQLRRAKYAPDLRGLYWLGLGLLLETLAWLLRIKFVAMASLVPTLAGCILALHGRELWKETRFAVGFLIFMAPIPGTLLNYPGALIQRASSAGAASIMEFLGYTISRQGNVIQIPGMTLEVAQACSGFKKLFALFAFSVLYGYLFDLPLRKRLLLVISVVPIALMANITRVAGLVAVSAAGGPRALHLAHDWAEIFVVIVSCVLFIALGRRLGCDHTRFAQDSPPASNGREPARENGSPASSRLTASTGLVCVFVLLALGANHAFGRLPYARPHIVPIWTFPTQVGDWKRVAELPVDPDIQKALPTAKLVQWFYMDSRGRQVELVLITASDYHDFHDPTVCFPGQGWALSNQHQVNIGRQRANYMLGSRNGNRLDVLYWVPGDYMASVDLGNPMKKMLSLRHLLTGEQGGSMVVRVTADHDLQGTQTAEEFAQQILPLVDALNSKAVH